MNAKAIKICLAASAGGHLTQLLKLSESWQGYKTFCVTTSDVVREKLQKYGKAYTVGECNREHPLRVIMVLMRCINVILHERPNVVISTGSAVGCIMCFLGKLLSAKIVWIDSIANVERISLSGRMVRRKAVDEVGLLDEDFFIYGEDIDWCKRFHQAGWDVMFYPGVEAIHIGGASSSNAPVRFYLEMQKADLQYWHKHHGCLGKLIYASIIFLRHLLRLMFGLLVFVFRPLRRPTTSFKLKRSLACIRWLFTYQGDKG